MAFFGLFPGGRRLNLREMQSGEGMFDILLIERILLIEKILTFLGGWVGGQLLIIKLISAQLSFAAAGTWLSLAKFPWLLFFPYHIYSIFFGP